jgi:hypothetical protein
MNKRSNFLAAILPSRPRQPARRTSWSWATRPPGR